VVSTQDCPGIFQYINHSRYNEVATGIRSSYASEEDTCDCFCPRTETGCSVSLNFHFVSVSLLSPLNFHNPIRCASTHCQQVPRLLKLVFQPSLSRSVAPATVTKRSIQSAQTGPTTSASERAIRMSALPSIPQSWRRIVLLLSVIVVALGFTTGSFGSSLKPNL
jgi:hypothetical protein